MYKVIWSEVSKNRILEIAQFISLDAPQAADRWIDMIFSKEKLMKDNPKIGKGVFEINDPNIREIIVGNYRLIYELKDKEIQVLTVINCKEQMFSSAIDK